MWIHHARRMEDGPSTYWIEPSGRAASVCSTAGWMMSMEATWERRCSKRAAEWVRSGRDGPPKNSKLGDPSGR